MADGTRDTVTITLAAGLLGVDRAAWDALANPPGERFDPFITWDFLEALEAAGCVGAGTGWTPRHVLAHDAQGCLVGAMPLYVKTHSMGEYVFDHAWADAMRRAGGLYYPKLQCAAPFTPVTGRRILARDPAVADALAMGAVDAVPVTRASSLHVTFPTEAEWTRLGALGFLRRTGVQFHWTNAGYSSFADFLGALSSSKRKTIRRERERAVEGLTVRCLEGDAITTTHWDFFFRCYMDTGARKWGQPYLNRDFFTQLATRMGDRCALFLAERDGRPVASALNLIGSDTLYGRYWGCVEDVQFLHFELCYYQAMDFAIARGLARVEAGAQGEHKLLRGYAPVTTYSAHWIAHPGLRNAVAHYLETERPAVAHEIEALAEHTPFRKGETP
ncbi:MAG: GNAT family N-acetyltransferase [Hyphomonadaceae bacterium]|nr:GNAT family N-acetyltransferase [Hyphomonadaceae bacterium]